LIAKPNGRFGKGGVRKLLSSNERLESHLIILGEVLSLSAIKIFPDVSKSINPVIPAKRSEVSDAS
jgi:hypothetical protein